ncbi:carbohydrate ABC transporter substrate-binding protein, CUT1 family [Jiangella alkaliphila]|uniref:Carbohydrate ABC transporter substrate-binding protein, CUT1 family n=2 Tax=Jiangella alkaliphila TaxID=419479 RepID=A0A1H2JMP8_9ACTN|nr:extracellular solute-binding protein [Jiangella alkaliphila]SDU57408.1 carbohydrate ABC transporter substrate-binding protein, CUT1 family [Jiangella alkaliphila]
MSTTYSRRRLLQLMGLGAGAVGFGGLAACAPSADDDSNTSGGSSSTPTSGGEAQDFSFASWSLSEEAPKPVIEGLVGAFAGDAGVSIAPVTYPYNEYLNQLTLQIRGGQFSGAAQVDVAWLGALAALGKLTDLSSFTEGRGYTDAALQAGQYEGTQYGLPWTIGAIGLVTNTELLQQAGVTTAPTTIEDFEAMLRELQGLGDGIVPYAASTKVAQLKDILIWMQTFGSPLIEDGQVTIGDDASVEAVTWYKRLYDDGLIAPDVDRFDARALFSQGRAVMYDDAIIGKSAVVRESPDPDFAAKLDPIARPVVQDGDDPRALFWGHAIVVVDGDGSGTAAEFAQWVTSDEATTVDFFEQLGLPPTTQAALDSDVVTGDTFTAAFSERVTATATVNPFWQFPQYAQMESAVAEQVQAVLVGSSSPADAMAAAGEAVQGLI